MFCSGNGAHRVGVLSICFNRYPEDDELHMKKLPGAPTVETSDKSKFWVFDATGRRVEF